MIEPVETRSPAERASLESAVTGSARPAGLAAVPPFASAFMEASGLQLEEAGSTHVTGWIDLGEAHHQPWGIVHGGVSSTAIESAASIGASLPAEEHGLLAVGVNNNTNFLRFSPLWPHPARRRLVL